jgi:glycosyltransferase involved in cell wall biosynthesis
MKVLHLLPHAGGGIGSVLMGWLEADKVNNHRVICLDSLNNKVKSFLHINRMPWAEEAQNHIGVIWVNMEQADIIVLHFWDHPMLAELISNPLPACRLAFWCHKFYSIPPKILSYPDQFIFTAPWKVFDRIPNIKMMRKELPFKIIKSTGNMERFLKLEKVACEGFNIGYVGTVDFKKVSAEFLLTLHKIGLAIPNARFTIVGEDHISDKIRFPWASDKERYIFTGKVDDIAPYLATMDVFGYPLQPDHYGTSEIVLGEAMAAGLPVVCMDNPAERLIVQEGVTGFLCKTEQEYVDNIEHLFHKPVLRRWMGWQAREAARKMYNINDMVDSWNRVFDQMMNEPKKEHSL